MIRKQTITTITESETQDFVWVVFLNHKESKVWSEHTEFHVFEDCEKARQWATKECHRLLSHIVTKMGVMPYFSSVIWSNDYELTMSLCDKDNTIQDQVKVTIHKKDII